MPTATILLLPPQSTLFFPSKPSFTIPSTKLNHHNFHHYQKLIPKSSPSQNESTPPETEYPVPLDQQPINEFKSFSKSFPFSWASGDFDDYCSRLAVTGASFALFIGLPFAWFGANGPESEPLKRVLEAISSGILVVIFVVVWMYLGWAYFGNRLVSPTVEYEEAGYDGQKIWVKTAEALARDRYLGSLSVKPVLSRLKLTLVSLVALLIWVFLLINTEDGKKDLYLTSEEDARRAIAGRLYNDDSARSYEPDAFCGEPDFPSCQS